MNKIGAILVEVVVGIILIKIVDELIAGANFTGTLGTVMSFLSLFIGVGILTAVIYYTARN